MNKKYWVVRHKIGAAAAVLGVLLVVAGAVSFAVNAPGHSSSTSAGCWVASQDGSVVAEQQVGQRCSYDGEQ